MWPGPTIDIRSLGGHMFSQAAFSPPPPHPPSLNCCFASVVRFSGITLKHAVPLKTVPPNRTRPKASRKECETLLQLIYFQATLCWIQHLPLMHCGRKLKQRLALFCFRLSSLGPYLEKYLWHSRLDRTINSYGITVNVLPWHYTTVVNDPAGCPDIQSSACKEEVYFHQRKQTPMHIYWKKEDGRLY